MSALRERYIEGHESDGVLLLHALDLLDEMAQAAGRSIRTLDDLFDACDLKTEQTDYDEVRGLNAAALAKYRGETRDG